MYWYNFYTYSNLLVRIELGPSWKNWSLHNLMGGIYLYNLPGFTSSAFKPIPNFKIPHVFLVKIGQRITPVTTKNRGLEALRAAAEPRASACKDCNVGPRNGCWLTKNPWIWVNYNHIVSYSIILYVIIYSWVNCISLTWNKAIWRWFPLLTRIPVRENSEVVII